MRHALAAFASLVLLFSGCQQQSSGPKVSKTPVSVRGWIADVDTGAATDTGVFRTVETEAARRAQLFQATQVWIENAPYVSGGIAENGSFILLDVPPGDVTITFSAPGVPTSHLTLQKVPSSADVLVPGVILKPNGVSFADPKQIRIRLAGAVSKPRGTPYKTLVSGVSVPVVEVPVNDMVDRRDYPNPPGFGAPLATVK